MKKKTVCQEPPASYKSLLCNIYITLLRQNIIITSTTVCARMCGIGLLCRRMLHLFSLCIIFRVGCYSLGCFISGSASRDSKGCKCSSSSFLLASKKPVLFLAGSAVSQRRSSSPQRSRHRNSHSALRLSARIPEEEENQLHASLII